MNPDRKEYYKKWYQDNKERVLKLGQIWRHNNPEKRKIIDKRSRNKNIDRYKTYQRSYKQKRRLDPRYVIEYRLRRRLNKTIAMAGAVKADSTFKLVGCSPTELILYLESTFTQGMSWAKRDELHIDHIKPCCSFDLTQPDEQRKCFHYTNLRVLWAEDNFDKIKADLTMKREETKKLP